MQLHVYCVSTRPQMRTQLLGTKLGVLCTQGTKCANKAWPLSQGGACKSGLRCYQISCAYWQCDTHQPPKEPKGECQHHTLPAAGWSCGQLSMLPLSESDDAELLRPERSARL